MHEIHVLFCSWHVVVLQYLLSKFSKKKQCAAIYFLPLFQCKTNTFALELLTEMIRPSPGNFFCQPYAVLDVHTCMEKVNRDVLVVPCF